MKTNLLSLNAFLALTGYLLLTQSIVAQSTIANPSGVQNPDRAARHWRISTDPTSRSTTVQFFSDEQRVLYEEVLPGRYVHLNDRNVAQLDGLLSRISANNLVASEVKTSPLLPTSLFYKERSSDESTLAVPTEATRQMVGLHTNLTYNANQKKLIVRLANPSGSRVNLRLSNERDHELYWNSVVAPAILQRFDMHDAPDGRYTLTVSRPYNREHYVQNVQIRSGKLIQLD